MIKTDNSAGKLYEFLTKLNETNEIFLSQKLAKVLGVEKDNTFALMRGLVELHYLIDDIEARVLSIEGINHQLLLDPLPRLRERLRVNNLNEVTSQSDALRFAKGDVTIIALIAQELSRHYSEEVIRSEQLVEINNEITDLYRMVVESPLDSELKATILHSLEVIRAAIKDYEIRGVIVLHQALATNVGTLVLHKPIFEQASDKEEVSRFKKILVGLDKIVSYAIKVKPLIGPATKIGQLLLGSDPKDPPSSTP